MRSLLFLLLPTLGFGTAAPPAKKLLVVSVDGLDRRYLRDRDQLGLRIPNIRRWVDDRTRTLAVLYLLQQRQPDLMLVMFGAAAKGSYFVPPAEKGNHGFWPLRHDYRSVFAIFGPGIKPRVEPEIQMVSVARRLAGILGLQFP